MTGDDDPRDPKARAKRLKEAAVLGPGAIDKAKQELGETTGGDEDDQGTGVRIPPEEKIH